MTGKYNLATAFETIYFWPGLEKCFAQVAKVLKPGGSFLVVCELNGADGSGRKYEKLIDGMNRISNSRSFDSELTFRQIFPSRNWQLRSG